MRYVNIKTTSLSQYEVAAFKNRYRREMAVPVSFYRVKEKQLRGLVCVPNCRKKRTEHKVITSVFLYLLYDVLATSDYITSDKK
jgi:hypothetical protein